MMSPRPDSSSHSRDGAKWALAATRLAAILPRDRFEPSVVAWAARSSRRARWSVAFSGGPDSLALLLLLWAHWPERRRALQALHFDHRLRGAESRGDAVFCRRVCAALKVKFITAVWKRERRGASEAEAREARLAFFQKNSRVLWQGHQQDDVAESMLMRLARGSGVGGLAAPRPVQFMPGKRVHLRPLLAVKKAEIVAALRGGDIEWREDSTNAGGAFFRNRIRHEVLPAWIRAAGRDAVAGAARSRELLEEDENALEAWLDELQALAPTGELQVRELAGKPRALVRRALHRWLRAQPHAGEISRQAFDGLLSAVEQGDATRRSLGREGFAVIRRGLLFFEIAGKPRRNFQRRIN